MAEFTEKRRTNRRQLDDFLVEVRANQQRLDRFQSLELALMRCASLPELLQRLLHEQWDDFRWDLITLSLHDPDYEIYRLLDASETRRADFPSLLLEADNTPQFNQLFESGRRPQLGVYKARCHVRLFPEKQARIGSVALLPLIRNRQLIGSLNIASYDRDRFQENKATDFMEHLAAVLSVCLETATIRERLRTLGLTDGLTGVNNRRFFDQRLTEEVERARRDEVELGCLFIDLDHFKAVNDTYGHQVGDEVLKNVAQIIRDQLRAVDVVARYGGEEFSVLLSQADSELAIEIAERIRKQVAVWVYDQMDLAIQITVSVGVATLQQVGDVQHRNLSELTHGLVEIADQAVYHAKKSGRNRVIYGKDEEYSPT